MLQPLYGSISPLGDSLNHLGKQWPNSPKMFDATPLLGCKTGVEDPSQSQQCPDEANLNRSKQQEIKGSLAIWSAVEEEKLGSLKGSRWGDRELASLGSALEVRDGGYSWRPLMLERKRGTAVEKALRKSPPILVPPPTQLQVGLHHSNNR